MSINAEFEYDPNNYVYIDVETGGLDPTKDSLLEVSYAIGNGPIKTLYPDLRWALESANPVALEVNKFVERFTAKDEQGIWIGVPKQFDQTDGKGLSTLIDGKECGLAFMALPPESTDAEWNAFLADVKGKIPVGANVHFDVAFVQNYCAPEPIKWSHRILSLNAWGAGILRSGSTVGFQDLIDSIDEALASTELISRVPAIDHTAAGDVEATRAVHQYLIWQYVTTRAVNDTGIPKFLWDEVRENN